MMPSERKAWIVYFALFAIVAAVSGFSYRLLSWGVEVLGCSDYRQPGTFMAYCGSAQYGDYEHGGFYFDLEPEAINNLRRAKVLILGSSRVQFAFSTDEVRD